MRDIIKQMLSGPGLAVAGGLLAMGGGIGAATALAVRPPDVMAPGAPVRIAALAGSDAHAVDGIVTVRGAVIETFGNQFVLTDGSGRALVDIGPHHDGMPLVALRQTVTVQGRYDDGVLHARYLVGADGRAVAVHGPGGPRGHGPGGRDHGALHDDAPRGPADAVPPPAAPAQG